MCTKFYDNDFYGCPPNQSNKGEFVEDIEKCLRPFSTMICEVDANAVST